MTTVRPEFATTSPEAASDELIRDYRDYLLAAAARANWHDTHRWEGPPPSVDAVRQALLAGHAEDVVEPRLEQVVRGLSRRRAPEADTLCHGDPPGYLHPHGASSARHDATGAASRARPS